MGSNVMSGVGCQRDQELANGGRYRVNTKYYNEGIRREHAMVPITLNEDFGHREYVQGDLVSMRQGKIVPLNPSLEFAGVIENIGQNNRGEYVASVATRGAIVVRVRGLNSETPTGAKVYAQPAGPREMFSLEEQGVLIGEICAIENREREMAIVGFRLASDQRRFELGGNRPSRSGWLV